MPVAIIDNGEIAEVGRGRNAFTGEVFPLPEVTVSDTTVVLAKQSATCTANEKRGWLRRKRRCGTTLLLERIAC